MQYFYKLELLLLIWSPTSSYPTTYALLTFFLYIPIILCQISLLDKNTKILFIQDSLYQLKKLEPMQVSTNFDGVHLWSCIHQKNAHSNPWGGWFPSYNKATVSTNYTKYLSSGVTNYYSINIKICTVLRTPTSLSILSVGLLLQYSKKGEMRKRGQDNHVSSLILTTATITAIIVTML